MARKVFISVLGTGYYEACKYRRGNFVSSETRFIQQATLEYLKVKNNWTTKNAEGDVIDRIVILLTDGAKETNWSKDTKTRLNRKSEMQEPYTRLEQILLDMKLPCPVETIHIPDGKTEEEMWTIFKRLYDALRPKDELYFDLTHSFRYLPMLVLVLGNYAKFLKNVLVKHISYGNYEARNMETNEAPLMDILPLSTLQDWTFAAADLIQNGNIERMQELREAQQLVDEPFTGYVNSLQNFLQDMKLCQGPNILQGNTINQISRYHQEVIGMLEQVIAPIAPIVKKIQISLRGFENTDASHTESLLNGYEAAKWCYDHQLYQQAITILDENITTHFCNLLGTDKYSYNQRTASNALLRYGEYREKDWDRKKKDMDDEEFANWERVKEIAQSGASLPSTRDFISLMRRDAVWIHNKRNSYNHASMSQNNTFTLMDVTTLGNKIRRIIGMAR